MKQHNLTTHLVKVSTHGTREKVFLVRRDGHPIGLISKRKNTRTEVHPWIAWRGVGENAKPVGFFYPEATRGLDLGPAATLHENPKLAALFEVAKRTH